MTYIFSLAIASKCVRLLGKGAYRYELVVWASERGIGQVDTAIWPAGVIVVSTARYQLDRAQTACGN